MYILFSYSFIVIYHNECSSRPYTKTLVCLSTYYCFQYLKGHVYVRNSRLSGSTSQFYFTLWAIVYTARKSSLFHCLYSIIGDDNPLRESLSLGDWDIPLPHPPCEVKVTKKLAWKARSLSFYQKDMIWREPFTSILVIQHFYEADMAHSCYIQGFRKIIRSHLLITLEFHGKQMPKIKFKALFKECCKNQTVREFLTSHKIRKLS